MKQKRSIVLWCVALLCGCSPLRAAEARRPATPGDQLLADYFKAETEALSDACLNDLKSLEDWTRQRERRRAELFEMLSLSPLPPRTDLRAEITGVVERDDFRIEKLHFQSMPRLYVTANLYLPKVLTNPAPAILYVCGHANVVDTNSGAILGNKAGYRHHGEWFARNGYVCLTIDTVQLGEIKGLHHGTYREGMWWWNARGYTSAGVEAWNSIRALDYLQSRPEVDRDRLGVTGRSGGGAYSWWITALDDRIKVAAPVAGITDLHNHIVDGVVEGHCDCMFTLNTYRWDYPLVAALAAPRPLLIANSDKDTIFPLDGVVRVHAKVAPIYKLYGRADRLGLLITEGPHRDTQDLQLPVFRWFNRHLKGEDPLIEMAARSTIPPTELRVFKTLPGDELTSSIHESFVPTAASPTPPSNTADWAAQTRQWRQALESRVFRGWPSPAPELKPALQAAQSTSAHRFEVYEFTSQEHVPLRLYVRRPQGTPELVRLTVLSSADWTNWVHRLQQRFPNALRDEVAGLASGSNARESQAPEPGAHVVDAWVAPRGVGLTAWNDTPRAQIHNRRRFMLLGQTLDSMRVWDIRRAIQALRSLERARSLPLTVAGQGEMGVNALYAALFERDLRQLDLADLPRSHAEGPDYLNVLRFLDIPQAVAMAAESSSLRLIGAEAQAWSYPTAVASNLGWGADRLSFR